MADNGVDVSVAAVLRIIRERDELRAAVAVVSARENETLRRVTALCDRADSVGRDPHDTAPRAGLLHPASVRAALRGES